MARFTFASNGKRDIHGVEEQFDKAFLALQHDAGWRFENNRAVVVEYVKACLLGEAKSAGKNRKVSKAWLYRVLGLLRTLSEELLQKDFDAAKPEHWKQFYENMELDILTKSSGEKYCPTTKSKYYKTIRKFLKWRYGGNRRYPDFCESWVTTEPMVTKPVLSRNEVDRLIMSAASIRVKCMMMMLFDGGFRVEELGNLRWCDVHKRDGKEYYQAHVRPETSKKKRERYVSLHLCTDLINTYQDAEHARLGSQFSETTYLFPRNYHGFYKTVRRLGRRALNKDISPHTLRHTSATYYADIIKTYQQFCTRYGWRLNSQVAQRYYHAVLDDEVAEQTKEHEIARFKGEFEKLKLENTTLQDELKRMGKDMESFKEAFFKHFIESGEADKIFQEYEALRRRDRMVRTW